MGKFDFKFDSELIKQLERMADYDNIAPRILEGVAPIIKRHIVSEADKYHEYSQDHELVNSIKESKSTKNKYGYFISVRPTGEDSGGVSNMEKMAHLEYGYYTKNGKHITAKPILTKAMNDASNEVSEAMQEAFNQIVEGNE